MIVGIDVLFAVRIKNGSAESELGHFPVNNFPGNENFINRRLLIFVPEHRRFGIFPVDTAQFLVRRKTDQGIQRRFSILIPADGEEMNPLPTAAAVGFFPDGEHDGIRAPRLVRIRPEIVHVIPDFDRGADAPGIGGDLIPDAEILIPFPVRICPVSPI